jgi:hypothetical protein
MMYYRTLSGDFLMDIVIYIVVTLFMVGYLVWWRAPFSGDVRDPDDALSHLERIDANLSSSYDDLRWDGTAYDHQDNTENWTGRNLRQIYVPMLPQAEEALRTFYLNILGMVEMRAPDGVSAVGSFWAVSGTRQVHFGQSSRFATVHEEPPAFVYPNLDDIAAKLSDAGHTSTWNTSLAYVRRLEVKDPAGNAIVLIGA